jgi:hypothetical protein
MSTTETVATCPRCGSGSVQAVPISKRSVAKALLVEGLFDSTAAGVAAGSSTTIQAVCLKCGCQWLPGSEQEHRLRALSGQLGDAARLAAERAVMREDQAKEEAERRLRFIIWIGAFVVLGIIILLVALNNTDFCKPRC